MITRLDINPHFSKPHLASSSPRTRLFNSPPFQSSLSYNFLVNSLRVQRKPPFFFNPILRASGSNSAITQEKDTESAQLFEKLKETERERINELEEFERKANVQLERQLVMASDWSRALLTMRGKLKGTEWDPETSHKIDYSEFKRLLDTNNVKYMEYSNYGQSVADF